MKTDQTTDPETATDSPDVAGCAAMPFYAMSDEDLRKAIELVRDLMSRSASKSCLWNRLENHLFDLLEIQRNRAGMAIHPAILSASYFEPNGHE